MPVSCWIEHAPFAFWLISVLKPDLVVELGRSGGDSFLAFCQAIKRLGLHARCRSIDVREEGDGNDAEGDRQAALDGNKEIFGAFSDWTRAAPHAWGRDIADGSIDLLHLRGDVARHFAGARIASLETKLSPRAVLLIHGIGEHEGSADARQLWQELAGAHPAFAFPHGGGLGVVGFGRDLPEPVVALLAARGDAAATEALHDIYGRLGHTVRVPDGGVAASAAAQSASAAAESLAREPASGSSRAGGSPRPVAEDAPIADLRARLAEVTDRLALADQCLQDVQASLAWWQDYGNKLKAELSHAQSAYEAVLKSTSWKLTAPLRRLSERLRDRRPALRGLARLAVMAATFRLRDYRAARRRIARSGLFDAAWYRRRYPEVARSGIDPLDHFLLIGNREGKDPNPCFRTQWYAATHAGAACDIPLLHYIEVGQAQGHRTAPDSRPSHSPAPDDDVHVERLAGLQFCARHQLSLDAPEPADIDGALAEVAAMTPVARIDATAPDVSIIIPVFGQCAATLNCLHSLANHSTRFSLEVIVSDDASPRASQIHRLSEVPWLRYLRRETNGGFIENCNAAAAQARGKYLVFLNNDTRVVRGWLDELIGSFEIFPQAGLIGSKLFNADGTLQEAGAIVWAGGTACNYGRGEESNDPRYCFARRADYCSGAAIAVPASLWTQLGGFDRHFAPAYCEDVDLAFRLRKAGREVWYQALARVVHYEGKSHGRDPGDGVKAYQTVNLQRLAERWHEVIAEHGPEWHLTDRQANRLARRRMLVIDARTPTPDQDAGSVVCSSTIRAMQHLGWHVIFVPADDYWYEPGYTDDLQRQGVECLYAPFVNSIGEVIDRYPDIDAILAFRGIILLPIYDELRRRLPTARIILHDIDLHYVREQREASLLGDFSKRAHAELRREQELALVADVDCTLVPTGAEKEILESELPVGNILHLPYVARVAKSAVAFEERRNLMFLGGFAHPPNVDAARFLVSEVWPSLLERLPPDAQLAIVGANPPQQVRALAGDRIVVTGYVPDLQPYFDSARVFVAPLRFGAGIKGKVVQSMGHGLPCVVSSVAAEGIAITPGRHALVADAPQDFAEAVLRLFHDRELWYAIQAAGYDLVEANFSWSQCVDVCRQALEVAEQTWLRRRKLQADRRIRARLLQAGILW